MHFTGGYKRDASALSCYRDVPFLNGSVAGAVQEGKTFVCGAAHHSRDVNGFFYVHILRENKQTARSEIPQLGSTLICATSKTNKEYCVTAALKVTPWSDGMTRRRGQERERASEALHAGRAPFFLQANGTHAAASSVMIINSTSHTGQSCVAGKTTHWREGEKETGEGQRRKRKKEKKKR